MGTDPGFSVENGAWEMANLADRKVETLSVDEADNRRTDPGTIVLDIRDIREVWVEGAIPDSEHVPRGMLEFWADPDTEYYRDFFHPENAYILYCNKGGRSAMAAVRLEEMGYPDVAHLDGGFTEWCDADKKTVDVPQKDYKNR